MIPAPTAEIWAQAREAEGAEPAELDAAYVQDGNKWLMRGCRCDVCKRVREIVRERYTFDKLNPQFGVTLALAEAWKLKQHFGPPRARSGQYNVTECRVCNFVVSRTVARKLGLPLPEWQGR